MNLYGIIIGICVVSGVGMMIWGWLVIVKGRQSKQWPKVEGEIIQSIPASDTGDLLPLIEFSYQVDGKLRQRNFEFPSGTMPTPEFNNQYLQRYPVGKRVDVHYEPDNIDNATLEPGMAQGDWLIFAIGVIAVGVGLAMFAAA